MKVWGLTWACRKVWVVQRHKFSSLLKIDWIIESMVWPSIFFSKGGKEVIINSAVTSLPNHVMSCYQIPKTVKSQRGWRVLWHSSGEVQGEVLEVCIGNHRIRFVSKRRREVKGLKVLWILILRCWENNYGVWSRNQVLYFLVFLKIGISGMHHP